MLAARRGPLAAKKIKELANWLETPYPGHAAPSHTQAQAVHDALLKVHPDIPKFQGMVEYDMKPVPEGKMPNLLNNVIRTVLSQNTNTASESCPRFADQTKRERARPFSPSLETRITSRSIAQAKRMSSMHFGVVDSPM